MTLSVCRWLAVLVVTVSMVGMAGCNTGRLQDERNALWSQNQELQDELNRSRSALDAAMAERAARDAEMARLRQQQQQPAPQPQQTRPIGGAERFQGIPDVQAEMRGRDIQVTVASDILFAPGSADLSSNARTALTRVANVLNRDYAGNQIVVEGHTDTDPIRRSRWASNQELSEARARAVADFLGQQGVPRNRMQTVGHGSTQPKQTKAASRRVEIVVMQ
jgi:flagellar motor protein MotB